MSKQPDRYSQLDGYLRAYYFFKDVLTDNKYNARPLTVEESEYWLKNIQQYIDKFEKEIEEL